MTRSDDDLLRIHELSVLLFFVLTLHSVYEGDDCEALCKNGATKKVEEAREIVQCHSICLASVRHWVDPRNQKKKKK